MATVIIGPKQPSEVLDYDVDFSKWLAAVNDTIASFTVTAANGITIQNSYAAYGAVKVFVAGGLSGKSYKITVRVTTAAGRVKEGEFTLKVKEL